mgnify:CR=1 FL=1
MDLCIKTITDHMHTIGAVGFNPCFNGSMYKNCAMIDYMSDSLEGFNPCFNGSMYKNCQVIFLAERK